MSDSFDPYYTWLGIQPSDQPPHCYRLLGIQLFEENRDVISNAADRQMAYLRSFQSGMHAAESQRLLNELSSARLRLLDDAKKKAYDDALRKQLQTPKPQAASPLPAVPMSRPKSQPPLRRSPTATRQPSPPTEESTSALTPLEGPATSPAAVVAQWDFHALLRTYRRALTDCQRLYATSARQCEENMTSLLGHSPEEFALWMDELHKRLLGKIYVTVAGADGMWSENEKRLAQVLIQHLRGERMEGEALYSIAAQIVKKAEQTTWYEVIRPFDQIVQLRDRVGELETIVMRAANLIAKTDGIPQPVELASLKMIEKEIATHLRPVPLDQPGQHEAAHVLEAEAAQQMAQDTAQLHLSVLPENQATTELTKEELLTETLEDIDNLIGLDEVKHNFHRIVDRMRQPAQTNTACHFAFLGSRGVGKTTVARKLGRVMRACGQLRNGHLVEVDAETLMEGGERFATRSVGKRLEEAEGGILFIDDAHTMLDDYRARPERRDAVALIVKRMGQQPATLAVILAGPTQPMNLVLKQTRGVQPLLADCWEFTDYSAGQLGAMFGQMCDKAQYSVPAATQARLLLGFHWTVRREQQSFNNGRYVRQTFEEAIGRLSLRVADQSLSGDLLSVIAPEDIQMPNVPDEAWQAQHRGEIRFSIRCPGCGVGAQIVAGILARQVKCNRCQERFRADWGEPLVD